MVNLTSKHIFISLIIFWVAWLYTEVSEFRSRAAFTHNVENFMTKGARNTAQMGYDLCKRIEHLEQNHHSTKSRPCEDIYKP